MLLQLFRLIYRLWVLMSKENIVEQNHIFRKIREIKFGHNALLWVDKNFDDCESFVSETYQSSILMSVQISSFILFFWFVKGSHKPFITFVINKAKVNFNNLNNTINKRQSSLSIRNKCHAQNCWLSHSHVTIKISIILLWNVQIVLHCFFVKFFT